MAVRTLYPEFHDELEPTRYPFADSASLLSQSQQQLAHDTFLDAAIYPIGGGVRMFISRIEVAAEAVTIVISDASYADKASTTFNPLMPPDLLRLTDDYGRPAGVLVSEALRLARFSAWAAGTQHFTLGATEFVASCVIPTPEIGVLGLLTARGELLTGDIWIVGDNGVVVQAENENTIRIDIVGEPLFVRKQCEDVDRFSPPLFVRTINGQPPDANGNFNLTIGDDFAPNTIVRLYPTDEGLQLEVVGTRIL